MHRPVRASLTSKQRMFAQAVANGIPRSAAYRHVYRSEAKPHNVRTEASRLARTPKITAAITMFMGDGAVSGKCRPHPLEAMRSGSEQERLKALQSLSKLANLCDR